MARKKTDADRLYNIKRRLMRAAKRAEKSGDKGLADYLRQESAQYKKGRSKTSAPKTSTVKNLIKGGTKFIKQTFKGQSKAPKTSAARKNVIFKQKYRSSNSVNKTLFFKATTQIWVGNEGDIYQQVLDYFYNSNTPDALAYRQWLKDNDLSNAKDLFNIQRYIEEQNKDALQRAEEEMRPQDGTPIAFKKLITFG